MYYVIISRHCASMQQELATTLHGRRDLRVIPDRRYGERRAGLQQIASDRRRTERRRNPGSPLMASGI